MERQNRHKTTSSYEFIKIMSWECNGSISDFYVKRVFGPNGSEGHKIWIFQNKNAKISLICPKWYTWSQWGIHNAKLRLSSGTVIILKCQKCTDTAFVAFISLVRSWISVITLITDFSDITIWSKLCRISGKEPLSLSILSIKVPALVSILSWDNIFHFRITCCGIWPLKVHKTHVCCCQK